MTALIDSIGSAIEGARSGQIFLMVMNFGSRRRRIVFAFLLSAFFVSEQASVAGPDCCGEREENASKLIEQAEEFRLNASLYHKLSVAQNKKASELSVRASRLTAGARKLNASIEERVKLGLPKKSDLNSYKQHLLEFQEHARLYNVHLSDYERQLAKAEAASRQLRAGCSQYADHVQKYHIPGVRPPHICVQLQWEEKEMQKAARNFQQDQLKTQKAEAALAKQEAELSQAIKERHDLENKLLQKSEIDLLERTQGLMLLKEFQAVEREYRLLEQEKKRIEKR